MATSLLAAALSAHRPAMLSGDGSADVAEHGAENLVVAGPSGTGKSHLLEAIGHHAIDQGLTVAWFSVEDLGGIVRRHRVDDTVSKAFAALASTSLTAIDDIGLLPISADAAEGLYRLVDAAYERRSLALSTNLHPSGFDQLMDRTGRSHVGSFVVTRRSPEAACSESESWT